MIVFVFLIVCLAVFPVQLWLCLSDKKLWIKLIPVVALGIYLLVSLVMANGVKYFGMEPDTALLGVIMLMVGIYLAIADGIAWLILLFRKVAQKHEK